MCDTCGTTFYSVLDVATHVWPIQAHSRSGLAFFRCHGGPHEACLALLWVQLICHLQRVYHSRSEFHQTSVDMAVIPEELIHCVRAIRDRCTVLIFADLCQNSGTIIFNFIQKSVSSIYWGPCIKYS